MNNLVYNQQILIPQNENLNFIINKYKFWNYSIIIQFNQTDSLNKLYLYWILKSYVSDKNFSPYMLATVFKKNNNHVISQKNSIEWYKNMDFTSFDNWISFRLKKDEEYWDDKYFYALILIYSKSLYELENNKKGIDVLEFLRPKFPWDEHWIDMYTNEVNKIILLEEKLINIERKLRIYEEKFGKI